MLTVNPTTGALLVEARELPAGSWLVQNAANSGVDRSVIAFAEERGLRTVNIVRREQQIAELGELGADLVLVDTPDVAARARAVIGDDPVLLGLDGVGGAATSLLLDVRTEGALLVVYGYMSGAPFTPDQSGSSRVVADPGQTHDRVLAAQWLCVGTVLIATGVAQGVSASFTHPGAMGALTG
ncbi:MDR/zinc-dependent alcohol dehydrogenase-like family protein [Streptomyces sasae]|uniref:zinc-binding dehydrogenase n=1 Tax=Streptomyces sasae TaxID=1266772 RepID=UPI00292F0CA2|nr:zinc-binding dehydrogenase [Streptomyces sasae]